LASNTTPPEKISFFQTQVAIELGVDRTPLE
jgi:hypothetical protein